MAKKASGSKVREVLKERHQQLLEDWVREQLAAPFRRPDLMGEGELLRESSEILDHLQSAALEGGLDDLKSDVWTPLREALDDFSTSRAQKGFSPSEVATFVFSLKQPLFSALRKAHGDATEGLVDDIWLVTRLLDDLGLHTNETYIKSRDRVIERQRLEMMELSSPVVKLWDGVLALPIIGVLDSERAQVVTENLLEKIVETGATIAIIDITGVQTVDTLVAQHLLKAVAAAQLMGADCIISGIRPQIAQTIVHLGIELQGVTTKATIADALAVALHRAGYRVEGTRA
ncbi:MAG: STAS domain-containing protein [Trueperaceae bacterium]